MFFWGRYTSIQNMALVISLSSSTTTLESQINEIGIERKLQISSSLISFLQAHHGKQFWI
jgi:hypothetical protein